jgi:hypothetical protein
MFSIHADLIHPTGTRHKFGADTKGFFNNSCQTGSLGLIVSSSAIMNFDVHVFSLLFF